MQVGDSVRTKVQFYFLDAENPQTGETVETRLPRWHRLTIRSVDRREHTASVGLPDGFVATISMDDLEP